MKTIINKNGTADHSSSTKTKRKANYFKNISKIGFEISKSTSVKTGSYKKCNGKIRVIAG